MQEGPEVWVALECMRPFAEGAQLNLDHDLTIRLPLSVASFCEPLPCDQAAFMTRWRATEGV